MEGREAVLRVSCSNPGSELPIVETIKCEYKNEDAFDESDINYINIEETIIEEDECSLDEFFSRTVMTEDSSQAVFVSAIRRGLSGIFKCFRCDYSCTSTKDLISHYQCYREKEPFTCYHCGFVGKDRIDFISHSHSHFQNTQYKCSKCPFETEVSSEIEEHVQNHSAKDSSAKMDVLKCPLCEKVFTSKWNLKLHLCRCEGPAGAEEGEDIQSLSSSSELPEKANVKPVKEEPDENSIFTCPECFFIFRSKEKLTQHRSKIHYKNKVMEEEDTSIDVAKNDTVGSKGKLEIKIEPNDEVVVIDEDIEVGPDMNPCVKLERIYLCPICHYVFTSYSSLNEHVITHETVIECSVCKFECQTNAQLQKHLATHTSSSDVANRHPCPVCGVKFPTLGKLKYHIRGEHSKKSFKCSFCPRIIKTENALRLHIEAHSKVKAYYCPKCNFSAKNSSLLQYHMSRYHPPSKKFVCDVCKKSYKYRYSLHRHRLNCPGRDALTDLKTFEEGKNGIPEIEIDISQKEKLNCSECKATFKEAAHLKRHLLIHYHRTPFRCMKCGLRCKTKHGLSQHMNNHYIKTNYQCKICHKRFKHRHALNNHSIIHSEERPFSCDICGMTFKRKANYRRHYDIHSDIKPFKCPSCNFTARRKDGLQKHLIKHESSDYVSPY